MRKIRRKMNINYKLITIIIIALFLIGISIGYSYLQTQLKIQGKATITYQEKSVSYPKGSSTCTYKFEKDSSQNNSEYTTYNVTLNVVNNDEEVNLWKIDFSVPESSKNIWCNYNYSQNNGRVTINYKSENVTFSKGSTQTINFKIDVKKDVNFTIKNLALNGLLTDLNAL